MWRNGRKPAEWRGPFDLPVGERGALEEREHGQGEGPEAHGVVGPKQRETHHGVDVEHDDENLDGLRAGEGRSND